MARGHEQLPRTEGNAVSSSRSERTAELPLEPACRCLLHGTHSWNSFCLFVAAIDFSNALNKVFNYGQCRSTSTTALCGSYHGRSSSTATSGVF
eukprot:6213268-Pleurochrysis_carterae.AAC.2